MRTLVILFSLFVCGGVLGEHGNEFQRGDVNEDGIDNIADFDFIKNYLFHEGPIPVCLDAADADDDGDIDLSDGVYILNYLFSGGEPYPEPFNCGTDPTHDGLDCDAYEPCD